MYAKEIFAFSLAISKIFRYNAFELCSKIFALHSPDRVKRQQEVFALNTKTRNMVGVALFSAIVVVLQLIFGSVTIGGTPINPVLVPVVVGAVIYDWQAGAWLGFVSGIAILVTGAASLFMGWNVAATIGTVLVKGAASGLVAGLVYQLLQKQNRTLAVFAAAIVCPLVNTGIFFLGCWAFFLKDLAGVAGGANVFVFILTVFIGINIFVELGLNLVLSPVIVRLIKLGKK